MTHEFADYNDAEQKEFLSLVQQMEWEPRVGDWCWNRISGAWLITAIIDYGWGITDGRGEISVSADEFAERNTWLPQAHDLLEMLPMGVQIVRCGTISVKSTNLFWTVNYGDEEDEIGESDHLCLALARAVMATKEWEV